MKEYFAYTRVSTARQGEKGVSLQEQRDAIERYAQREGIKIKAWFEERVTAAKVGRRVFNTMIDQVRRNNVAGIVIHKIDRSARNLKDWALLGELIDEGVEVRITTESMDLSSRGGRLSADLQAVIAADYIRNLRDEVRKGFYGRLKQGFYPMAAPLGYIDNGGGQVKTPDPERAPLIASMFEFYATGAYTLDTLATKMREMGLRSKSGRALAGKHLSQLLHNPFYAGLMHIRKTNETYQGKHTPLVTQTLFDEVQGILHGRTPRCHKFLFPRLITCSGCGFSLIGEAQKGHVYYRCHSKSCPGVSVREDRANHYIAELFRAVQLPKHLAVAIEAELPRCDGRLVEGRADLIKKLHVARARYRDRLERLTDALVDGLVTKDVFDERRKGLLRSINVAEQDLAKIEKEGDEFERRVRKNLELWKSLYSSYISAGRDEKRKLLLVATSNRLVCRKDLMIELSEPFLTFSKTSFAYTGLPPRRLSRTLLDVLLDVSKRMASL